MNRADELLNKCKQNLSKFAKHYWLGRRGHEISSSRFIDFIGIAQQVSIFPEKTGQIDPFVIDFTIEDEECKDEEIL
jgi:hypothetical protein